MVFIKYCGGDVKKIVECVVFVIGEVGKFVVLVDCIGCFE